MRCLATLGAALSLVLAVTATPFRDGKGLFNRRLGMFVHWGVCSVGAWHEQEFSRSRMPCRRLYLHLVDYPSEPLKLDFADQIVCRVKF